MSDATKTPLGNLEFVRLKIPRLIPKELIEAVKGLSYSPEVFYKYQEDQADNPFNHLYAFVDAGKVIRGYLWAESNMLDNTLFINTFSIGKEYWGKGKAIERAVDFCDALAKKTKAPKVFWITTNEKFFIKHGFKRSKLHLMEYSH